MSDNTAFAGVLVPVLTPFDAELAPDVGRFVTQSRDLLAQGADGLAVFGTTSEGNALGLEEKSRLLDALHEAEVPGAKLMPGTGLCALPETVALTRKAVTQGCAGVLLLPPFYYKMVDDEGLFAYVSEVIQRVGDSRLRIYLYHIPPVAQVGWSLPLIERLVAAYPKTVVGIKDSSGDWSNTEAILRALPDFETFVGSEAFLLANLKAGGRGCITATANVALPSIRAVFAAWQASGAGDEVEGLNETMVAQRKAIQAFPMIPALKEVLALRLDDPEWRRLRPPLAGLSASQAGALRNDLSVVSLL